MPEFSPEQLAEWSGGHWFRGRPRKAAGFAIDTRRLRPGEIFVALKTSRRDGHDFLPDALERGACGAVVARLDENLGLPQLKVADPAAALQNMAARHRGSFRGPVIGITGSCGKTSAKEMLALLLGDGEVYRTPGNRNNHLGLALSLLQIDARRHRFAVLEAGISRPGEMAALARMMQPDHAIVTHVGPAHLEGLGDMDTVAWEKSVLPRNLRNGGSVFFPSSCMKYRCFRDLPAKCVVLSEKNEGVPFLVNGHAYALLADTTNWTELAHGCRISLRQPCASPRQYQLPPMSPGMVRNAALALLAASSLGISAAVLQSRVARWRPPAFRGQILEMGSRWFYVDCYNANPASMKDAIGAFQQIFPNGPRLYVLGAMSELGSASSRLHLDLGRSIQLAPGDRAALAGPDAEALREGLIEAGAAPEQAGVYGGLEEMRFILDSFPGPVLLKGSRGCRLEMLLPNGREQPERERKKAC